MGEEARERDRPPTGGSACIPGGNDGHEVNQHPDVGAVLLQTLKTGWPHWNNRQYRGKNRNQKLMELRETRGWVREGGSASRASGDQSSTDPGGGPRRNKQWRPHWHEWGDNSTRDLWAADSQEFPPLGAQKTAGKAKGSAGPSNTEMDRRLMGHPTPVFRNLDKEMRLTKDTRSVPGGNCNAQTWGVQKPIVTPFSPLAESFTPRQIRTTDPTTAHGQ